MTALFSTYLAKTVAVLEIVGSLLVFSKKLELIGLLILLPITINAFAFHLFYDIQGIAPALLVIVSNIVLLILNKKRLAYLIQSQP